MTMLDPRTAGRLAKLCGMFGSDHVGERAAAAAKADKLVRAKGLTWFQVLRTEPSFRDQIKFALEHDDLLSAWEREFLTSIRRQRKLTEKQLAVLEDICAKVRDLNGEGA